MYLIAMMGTERVDATQFTPEAWAELKESESRKDLTMPVCGIRAIAKSRGETQFFAHHRVERCDVEHGGESLQHLAMKEALAIAIDAVPGWHAVKEHADQPRRWIIDVLAESDAAPRRRYAFEVQLSPQSPQGYFHRSDRYFADGIYPVWLIARPLEWNQVKVPTVVTGFGARSPLPAEAADLLRLEVVDMTGGQTEDAILLGELIRVLLTDGPRQPYPAPSVQQGRIRAEKERAEAARLRREQAEAEFRAAVDAMNQNSAPASAAFGDHVVRTEEDAFVFATMNGCYRCGQPMILWAARSPGFGKHWATVPTGPKVRADVNQKRFENSSQVHAAVDAWMRAVEADARKARIELRRTKASGREYSAFVCPHCEAAIGQVFIACLEPDKWSIIAGPEVVPQKQRPPQGSQTESTRARRRRKAAAQAQTEAVIAASRAASVHGSETAADSGSTGAAEAESAEHRRREREQLEGRSMQQIEADRTALEAWLAKDRASYGVSGQELARREQVRIDRAAEVEAFNANPQYVRHGGRHICRACGGFIDDEREGRHKGGRCAT